MTPLLKKEIRPPRQPEPLGNVLASNPQPIE